MDIDNIYINLFGVNFQSFKGLKEFEYDILKDNFKKIDKNCITFDLQENNKKIQPLELIIKLLSNKLVGSLIIDLHNKDGVILGKLTFKNFLFKKIEDFIDFDFDSEDTTKELKVSYEYDDIIYISNNGKEDKIN